MAGILCMAGWSVLAQDPSYTINPLPPIEVLISVSDQKLVIMRDGGLVAKYSISTSKFGIGDGYGSYKTPIGKFRVCEKIGDDLPEGAVIKNRNATGEVIPVNAPGRDPIVTRVIWLDGMEEQNHNARARGIYIHGTPEETNIGKPASYGCIRMKSKDVVSIYDELPAGTIVTIMMERLPKMHKYKIPPPPPVIVTATPTPAAVQTVASAVPSVEAKTKIQSVAKSSVTPLPQVAERVTFTESGNAPVKPAKVSSNPAALNALKGSILMAGLPGAPVSSSAEPSDKLAGEGVSASVSGAKTKPQP